MGGAIATAAEHDPWAQWILHERHLDDEVTRRAVLDELVPVRDRVLRKAEIHRNDRVLDLGCGDGLLGLEAAREHPHAEITFADVSGVLLAHCKARAADLGVLARCRFHTVPATHLDGLQTDYYSVAVLRSVLVYHPDPRRCARELRRVVTAGGRVSGFEPLAPVMFDDAQSGFFGYDLGAAAGMGLRIRAQYGQLLRERVPLLFALHEGELVDWFERAAFEEIRARIHVLSAPMPVVSFDRFYRSPRNPLVPSFERIAQELLTKAERLAFEEALMRAVRSGNGRKQTSVCYFIAQ